MLLPVVHENAGQEEREKKKPPSPPVFVIRKLSPIFPLDLGCFLLGVFFKTEPRNHGHMLTSKRRLLYSNTPHHLTIHQKAQKSTSPSRRLCISKPGTQYPWVLRWKVRQLLSRCTKAQRGVGSSYSSLLSKSQPFYFFFTDAILTCNTEGVSKLAGG